MTMPPLRPVAELAGYPLLDDELAAAASLLSGVMEDIKRLPWRAASVSGALTTFGFLGLTSNPNVLVEGKSFAEAATERGPADPRAPDRG